MFNQYSVNGINGFTGIAILTFLAMFFSVMQGEEFRVAL
jgi:hypothetical protein